MFEEAAELCWPVEKEKDYKAGAPHSCNNCFLFHFWAAVRVRGAWSCIMF